MGRTFQEALAKAIAADRVEGEYVSHRSDSVLFRMLDVVGRRARGEIPATRPASASQAARSGGQEGVGGPKGDKVPARVLVKAQPASQGQERDDARLHAIADVAHKARKPDDAKVLRASVAALSPEQLAAAVDAAVVAGKISGTEAVALLERVKGKR